MRKFFFLYFFVCSALIYSQSRTYSPFEIDWKNTSSLPSEISSKVDGAVILKANENAFADIVNEKAANINLEIPLGGLGTLDAAMKKFEILNPSSRIVEGTDYGDKDVNFKNELVAYTGKVDRIPNSTLVCTFFGDYAAGILITPEESYVFGKTSFNPNEKEYVVYQTSRMKIKRDFVCGSDAMEIPQRIIEMQKSLSNIPKDFSTSNLLKANLAIESDFDTYTHFGSSLTNTTKYLLSLLTMVSAVYVKDINVQLYVSYLRVWTTSNDPYNGTTSGALLTEFRNYWNSNMQAVSRTIAHYITTRPGGLGGVAWVGVLCDPVSNGYGYAFSDIDGVYNYLPSYSWDVDVVSHETGHNFGSPHTHNCSWAGGPIDTCYVPVEGGCYSGAAIPRVGTIMSYCHLNATKVLEFGPQPTQLIRTNAETAPCIGNLSFLLALPNGGEIFRNGESRMIIWGTSITGNVNIEYSTNNGTSWNTVQNNVPAVNRIFAWQVPLVPTTTQAKVRVYESGNPANGDVSDSVFQIRPTLNTFNMVWPPQLARYYTNSSDTATVNFTWTKTATLPELQYKWNLAKFDLSQSITQFSNNSGHDSIYSTRINKIDSIIASWGVQIGDSIRCKWYTRGYTMLDSAMPLTSSFLITFIRQIVGVKPVSSGVPKEFYVNQNYPNPFNPETKIKFGLPKRGFVKLTVYNALGKEVEILVNNILDAGVYEAVWNANSYPSGVYFYRVQAAEETEKTGKMVLVK